MLQLKESKVKVMATIDWRLFLWLPLWQTNPKYTGLSVASYELFGWSYLNVDPMDPILVLNYGKSSEYLQNNSSNILDLKWLLTVEDGSRSFTEMVSLNRRCNTRSMLGKRNHIVGKFLFICCNKYQFYYILLHFFGWFFCCQLP